MNNNLKLIAGFNELAFTFSGRMDGSAPNSFSESDAFGKHESIHEIISIMNEFNQTLMSYTLERTDQGRIELAGEMLRRLETIKINLINFDTAHETPQIISALKRSIEGIEGYAVLIENFHQTNMALWELQDRQQKIASEVIKQAGIVRDGVQATNEEVYSVRNNNDDCIFFARFYRKHYHCCGIIK